MADSISQQAPAAELNLSEAIQYLPPELREIIYKEYLAIEKLMGWGQVHNELLEAPFCDARSRIVKVIKCRKCNTCGRDGLCYECLKNKVEHYLCPPWLVVVEDHDENFIKILVVRGNDSPENLQNVLD